MTIGFLTTPEIDEASKAQLVIEEVQAPHTRQLGAGIRVGVVVALKELLVERLHRPCLGEVGSVSIISSTNKSSLLETTRTTQAAIVLNMSSKGRLLAQIELTRNLRIGALNEMTTHIDIHEIVPRTPLVSLKLLEGYSHLCATSLFTRVNVTTKVVVQLNVLCTDHRCKGQAQD